MRASARPASTSGSSRTPGARAFRSATARARTPPTHDTRACRFWSAKATGRGWRGPRASRSAAPAQRGRGRSDRCAGQAHSVEIVGDGEVCGDRGRGKQSLDLSSEGGVSVAGRGNHVQHPLPDLVFAVLAKACATLQQRRDIRRRRVWEQRSHAGKRSGRAPARGYRRLGMAHAAPGSLGLSRPRLRPARRLARPAPLERPRRRNRADGRAPVPAQPQPGRPRLRSPGSC